MKEADSLGQVFDPNYDGEHCCGTKEFVAKTNADHIRHMSDEELAKLLCHIGWRMDEYEDCLNWLNLPYEKI